MKVGFFGQDRASQTEISEVVQVNDLSGALRNLLRDFLDLKREFILTRGSLFSDLEHKLAEKATELYFLMILSYINFVLFMLFSLYIYYY